MKSNRSSSAKKSATKRKAATATANGAQGSVTAIATASDYLKGKQGVLELPSGARFVVRRPRPTIAIHFNRLPANLRQRALESIQGKKVNALPQTEEEEKAFMDYARAMVADICVSPRVEVGTKSAGVLEVDDIEPIDFWKLFDWGERGGATLPMDTEGGGSLSVAELESFRGESAVSNAVPDGASGGREAVPSP